MVGDGVDPESERQRIMGEFTEMLINFLMVIDEHPTVTRFWTFREALGRMLAMIIIGFPKNALRLITLKPRPQNQKRLRLVLGFFEDPSCPQLLRRICLTLQVTGAVTSSTGYKDNATTATPILVRFFKSGAHNAAQTEFSHILGSMWFDRELEAGLAVTALLATAMDLVLRLQQYREYPRRLSALLFVAVEKNRLEQGH